MSNPHSPEPSRWILEMFAPDIPPWNRAFIQLERKPLNALEETLVYSFDRYLRRKGYLTKRQVEVLEGIARKHNVVLPLIPPTPHHTESTPSQEATAPLRQIRIPELEKPQNARWLALLIDTEGALGWVKETERKDRINEQYRYTYVYRTIYVSVGMAEIESKKTVDKGAELIGAKPYTDIMGRRLLFAHRGRAYSAIRYMKPHLDKFNRLANLCLTLFKYHTTIPIEKFNRVIETLFQWYLPSKDVKDKLLRMTEEESKELLKRAEELTDRFLKY